jgi:hypothetical protein
MDAMHSSRSRFFALLAGLSCAVAGCEFSDTRVEETPAERVLIRDEDGRLWDVTQAVVRYGFERSGFLFGLGAYTVTPLVTPAAAAPGDSGYPGDAESFDVLGVSLAGQSRAYRLDHILDVEVVDDTLAGTPVVVVHRPLIASPSAHTRVLAGETLTLSASGWLYEGQSVLFDYETESLWYRLDGETHLTCIAGKHFGSTLPAVPSARRRWSAWRASYPATSYMLNP